MKSSTSTRSSGSQMKPGDLARLRDVGIMSGKIVMVLRVRGIIPHSDIVVVDFLLGGELQEGFHIDFFEAIDEAR